MSDLGGTLIYFDPGAVVVAARERTLPVFDGWLTAAESLAVSGERTDTQPVTEPGLSLSGSLGSGINSMLYGRVYIVPGSLTLGNLVSAQIRTLRAWNATYGTATLNSIVETGTEGLTLTSPFSIPHTFAPFEEATFELNITLTGPATISANYRFNFDLEQINVGVTGSRVTLWPFAPNWKAPVDEFLEWSTNVITSHDGTEQRVQLRSKARRGIEYDFLLGREDSQRFDNITWGWQNRIFAVPYWQYQSRLGADVLVGDTTLTANTVDSGFLAGETAVIFSSPASYEVVEIASVSPTSISLTRGTISAWPAGTRLLPMSIARVVGNIPVTRQTDRALSGRVSFTGSPAVTDPYTPTAAAPTIYNGFEVITRQPDWSGGVTNDIDYPNDAIDFNTGAFALSVTRDTPVLMKRYRWLLKSRTAIREFREFLKRRSGMAVPVYIPSWHDDLTPVAAIGSAATTISCIDRDFFTLVGVDPARAHIAIRARSGVTYYRPITTVSKSGDDLVIGIGTALGVTLQVSDVKAIHFLGLYRLAADRVNLEWHTESVATVDATFQLVKA